MDRKEEVFRQIVIENKAHVICVADYFAPSDLRPSGFNTLPSKHTLPVNYLCSPTISLSEDQKSVELLKISTKSQ
jgi:hypothetical protein